MTLPSDEHAEANFHEARARVVSARQALDAARARLALATADVDVAEYAWRKAVADAAHWAELCTIDTW